MQLLPPSSSNTIIKVIIRFAAAAAADCVLVVDLYPSPFRGHDKSKQTEQKHTEQQGVEREWFICSMCHICTATGFGAQLQSLGQRLHRDKHNAVGIEMLLFWHAEGLLNLNSAESISQNNALPSFPSPLPPYPALLNERYYISIFGLLRLVRLGFIAW